MKARRLFVRHVHGTSLHIIRFQIVKAPSCHRVRFNAARFHPDHESQRYVKRSLLKTCARRLYGVCPDGAQGQLELRRAGYRAHG
jgi:hypothetical protein